MCFCVHRLSVGLINVAKVAGDGEELLLIPDFNQTLK